MTARLLRPGIVIVVLLFSGCMTVPPAPESPPEAEPAEQKDDIVVLPPLPEPAPEIVAPPPAPPPLPSVAIVMTSSLAAYADVAGELAKRFEDHQTFNLDEDGRAAASILRMINDSDAAVVVAIGLPAAASSVAMSTKPVIFSQVFNAQSLHTETSRGVSSIAPLEAQIAAWREIDPSVSRIGLIVGAGHQDLIDEAKLAAEQNGAELRVHVAHSDQETVYFFKRMIRNIDGFWLLPDNRILSRRALQQIMEGAGHQGVPVLAPTESMLSMGASVSISTVAADIAETILSIVQRIEAGNIADVPPISPLSALRIVSSDASRVVQR